MRRTIAQALDPTADGFSRGGVEMALGGIVDRTRRLSLGSVAEIGSNVQADLDSKAAFYTWALRCMSDAYKSEVGLDVARGNEAARAYTEIMRQVRAMTLQPGEGLRFPYDWSQPGVDSDGADASGGPRAVVAASAARLAGAADALRLHAQGALEKFRGRVGERSGGFWTGSDRRDLLAALERLEGASAAARADYEAYVAGMGEIVSDYAAWMRGFADARDGPGASVLEGVLHAMEALAAAAAGAPGE